MKHDDKMQNGILDWIREQQEDIDEKIGEIQIKSGVELTVIYHSFSEKYSTIV